MIPVKTIDMKALSKTCSVRKLGLQDAQRVYELCMTNPQYYEYCGKKPSVGLVERDMTITPPGIPMAQKYYFGFFIRDELIAVMDLIAGYPNSQCAFIGFFMMHGRHQGQGLGTRLVAEVLAYLKELGFTQCRLGIDRENPQSNHFWRKNGFEVIREVETEEGTVLLAAKTI